MWDWCSLRNHVYYVHEYVICKNEVLMCICMLLPMPHLPRKEGLETSWSIIFNNEAQERLEYSVSTPVQSKKRKMRHMHQVQLVMFLDAWFIVCAQYLGDASENRFTLIPSMFRQNILAFSLPSPSCFPSGLLLLPSFLPPYRSKMGLSKPRCVHLLQLCKYPPAAGCTHLKSAVCAWQVDRRYVGGVLAFFFTKQTEYIVSLYEFSWNPYLQNPCIARCIARNGVMTSLFTQVYQILVP